MGDWYEPDKIPFTDNSIQVLSVSLTRSPKSRNTRDNIWRLSLYDIRHTKFPYLVGRDSVKSIEGGAPSSFDSDKAPSPIASSSSETQTIDKGAQRTSS